MTRKKDGFPQNYRDRHAQFELRSWLSIDEKMLLRILIEKDVLTENDLAMHGNRLVFSRRLLSVRFVVRVLLPPEPLKA